MSENVNAQTESSEKSSEPPKSSGHPVSRTRHFIEKANAMKGVLLAVSALAASVASFFKPQDTTATKNSYEHTAKQIETLSAVSVQNHDDIIALRSFLEGYVRAQKPETKPESGQGFGSGSGRLGGSSRRSTAPQVARAPSPKPPEAQKELPPPPLPSLPPESPRPKAFKAESFEEVITTAF
jgi:hypothetical protein